MKLPLYALLFPASQAALLGALLTLLAEHGMTAGMWILMILLSVLCALCDWLLFRTLKQLTQRRPYGDGAGRREVCRDGLAEGGGADGRKRIVTKKRLFITFPF